MNLTIASKLFKYSLRVLLGLVVMYYLTVYALIPLSKSAIKSLFPPKNPPNPVFGKLTQLKFYEKQISGKPQYILNTKNGNLPTGMPKKMPVYRFKTPPFSYLSGKLAVQDAAALGFSDNDLVSDLKSDIYKWRNLSTSSTLEIKTKTGELTLSTSLEGKELWFPKENLTKNESAAIALGLIKRLRRFNDPLYTGGYQVIHLGSYTKQTLIETQNAQDAQIARIDYFRKNIDKFPIYGPDPKQGLIHIYVKKPVNPPLPINNPVFKYSYWEIDTNPNATYPILPVASVWASVSSGGGVIVNVTPKNKNPFEEYKTVSVDKILINDIFLAYYETPEYQDHLQPIYVLQGNYTFAGTGGGDITIFFPAVTGDYVK